MSYLDPESNQEIFESLDFELPILSDDLNPEFLENDQKISNESDATQLNFLLEDLGSFPDRLNNLSKKSRNIKKDSDFKIPTYVYSIPSEKERKKEIQKLKNRESAQISRDKKKKEYVDLQYKVKYFQEENARLMNENQILIKKMNENKCENCGYINGAINNGSELEDYLSTNEISTRLSQRSSNNSFFLSSLMIIGMVAFCCVAIPYFQRNEAMNSANGNSIFVEMKKNITNIIQDEKCSNSLPAFDNFEKSEEFHKFSKTAELLKKELASHLKDENKNNTSLIMSKKGIKSKNEKFLEKTNYPIVPYNYFLDKITTIFCPKSYILDNNNNKTNSTDKENIINIKGDWLHLLVPKISSLSPEINNQANEPDFRYYLEIWAKIYGIREISKIC